MESNVVCWLGFADVLDVAGGHAVHVVAEQDVGDFHVTVASEDLLGVVAEDFGE